MLHSLMRLMGLRKEWPLYTLDDVREHNNRFSVWLVKGNSVYDVTSILDSHPGGANALLRRSGGVKDCTEDYHFHSRAARRTWASFKIGELAPGEMVGKGVQETVSLDTMNRRKTTDVLPVNGVCTKRDCVGGGDCCCTCTVETHESFSEPVPERLCGECLHCQSQRQVFR